MYIEATTPIHRQSSILDRLIGRRHEQIYSAFVNTIEEDENKKRRACLDSLEAANEVECGIAAGLSDNIMIEWGPIQSDIYQIDGHCAPKDRNNRLAEWKAN